MPTQSYQRILELLDHHGVEFIVVGGVAAVLQGAPITTFDIDMLVKLDDVNAEKLLGALNELEARFRGQPQAGAPSKKDILAGGHLMLRCAIEPTSSARGFRDHVHRQFPAPYQALSNCRVRDRRNLRVRALYFRRDVQHLLRRQAALCKPPGRGRGVWS